MHDENRAAVTNEFKQRPHEAEAERLDAENREFARTLAADMMGRAADERDAGILKTPIGTAKKVVQQQLDLGSWLLAGGELTNRPPAISQSVSGSGRENQSLAEFAGGEDWFEASLWVEWENWESLQTQLEAARQAAKKQAEGEDVDRANCVVIWNQEYLVHATGAASSGKGRVYRYRLQKDGVTYLIANTGETCEQFANMRFVVGSLPLMLRSAREIWEQVKSDIDDLGGTITRSTLSRVDVCVDLPNEDVGQFEERWRRGQFVTRARESEEYVPEGETTIHWIGRGEKRRCTGVTIGAAGAKCKLNVYDKLHEVTKKNDETKLQALIQYRWGGKLPECATRVEVQMRRDKIKELGVDSVDDWFREAGGIARYVFCDWMRFTEADVDFANNKQSYAQTWSLWERIACSAQIVCGGVGRLVQPRRRVQFCFKQLAAQTLGTLSSSITYARGVIMDKGEFMAEAIHELCKTIEAKDWGEFVKRACRKRSEFEASMPTTAAL